LAGCFLGGGGGGGGGGGLFGDGLFAGSGIGLATGECVFVNL